MNDVPDFPLDEHLRTAIAQRRLIEFVLDGFRRTGEPHDYGIMNGERRLFFYQTGGEGRSRPATGWRWAALDRMQDLKILDEQFPGPRAAPSGRHVQWDALFATVSPRPVVRE